MTKNTETEKPPKNHKLLPKGFLFSDYEVGTEDAVKAADAIYNYMAETGKNGDIFCDAEGMCREYHSRGIVRGRNMVENMLLAETESEINCLLSWYNQFLIYPQPGATDAPGAVVEAAKAKLVDLRKTDKSLLMLSENEGLAILEDKVIRLEALTEQRRIEQVKFQGKLDDLEWLAIKTNADEGPVDPPKDNTCEHNTNFTSVTWNGMPYTFNSKQAIIIELLWKASCKNIGVDQKTVAKHINTVANEYRFIDSFRSHNKTHPAWGTMIEYIGNGVYALVKPD
jgi:hypothetical protein